MDAVVNTRPGKVRGSVAAGVHTFQGIPYAAPPFGANRLRPPQPVTPWSGVRDALTYGPKTPQLPYPPPVDVLLPELTVPGEDCLNLNVWSPDLGSAGHPVLVWIPGGMFEYHGTGAAPWYDGSRFARDGIVCVTINLVLAHSRYPPHRRTREEPRGHLHVRVCLALTAVRWAPRCVPCARDCLRLRLAWPRDGAAAGHRPSTTAR